MDSFVCCLQIGAHGLLQSKEQNTAKTNLREHACMSACMHALARTYKHSCTHTHTHIYTHRHIVTHAHTHTHTLEWRVHTKMVIL